MEKLPVDCKHIFQQVAHLLGLFVCPGEAVASAQSIWTFGFTHRDTEDSLFVCVPTLFSTAVTLF